MLILAPIQRFKIFAISFIAHYEQGKEFSFQTYLQQIFVAVFFSHFYVVDGHFFYTPTAS